MPQSSSNLLRRLRASNLGFLLFPLAALLVYAPCLRGGFLWDDNMYLVDNPLMRDPAGWIRAWTDPMSLPDPYPLVFSVLWIGHRFWGLDPLGYHLINIVLHGLNAALIGRLFIRLRLPFPAITACLFLVHPAHVESVAWITELKNVLSCMFYLLAAHAWLRWMERPGWPMWAAALVCFLAALMSKTTMVTFAVAALIGACAAGGDGLRRRAAAALPLFAAGVVCAAAVIGFQVRQHQSVGDAYDFSFMERILIACRALCFYAGKFLWPSGLMAVYPRWNVSASNPAMWIFPPVTVGMVAGLVILWRRGSRLPLWGAGFYALTVSPALGFFNYSTMRLSLVADHYQYLAGIGIFTVLLGWARRAADCRMVPRAPRNGFAVLLSCALLLAASLAASHYRSAADLFTVNARGNPDSAFVNWNAAAGLTQQGRNKEALPHAERAHELSPDDPDAISTLAGVLVNLGRAEEAAGLIGGAAAQRPTAQTLLIAARSEEERGRMAEAAVYYKSLVEQFPGNEPGLVSYGAFLNRNGRFDEAEGILARALAINADNASARISYATSLFELGRTNDAVKEMKIVIEAHPENDEAHFMLGVMLMRTAKPEEGKSHLDEAIRLNPAFGERMKKIGEGTTR